MLSLDEQCELLSFLSNPSTVVSKLCLKTKLILSNLMGDGQWDWDIPSGYVNFSPLWISMLGYNPGELNPNAATFFELIHPEDQEYCLDQLTQHLQGNISRYHCSIRLRSKSGQYKRVVCSGVIVERDPEGQPIRMVGTHRDRD